MKKTRSEKSRDTVPLNCAKVIPKPTVPRQCPVVPFLRPGIPFNDLVMAPSGKRLGVAVSAFMRKAGQPDIRDNGRSVVRKWKEIRSNPRLSWSLPIRTQRGPSWSPATSQRVSFIELNAVFYRRSSRLANL